MTVFVILFCDYNTSYHGYKISNHGYKISNHGYNAYNNNKQYRTLNVSVKNKKWQTLKLLNGWTFHHAPQIFLQSRVYNYREIKGN